MPCISLEGWSGAGPLTDLRISVALYARCGNLVCGNWGLSLCLRSVRIMALRGVTAARSVGGRRGDGSVDTVVSAFFVSLFEIMF